METRTARAAWMPNRFTIQSIGSLLFFFVAFFAKVIVTRRFIITGDPFYYSYPLRSVAWNMIANGQMPLWTPLFLSGYPLLAVAQLGIGYPLTWLHLILPGHVAEQIYAMAPFVIAPITTFAYLRTIGRSYMASIFGGLAFTYGGMMCGILANSGMLTNGFAWAPLTLLFIDRARTRSFAHCVVWASLTYGLAVLAGHSQSYVYIGALVVAYGLFTSISLRLFHTRSWASWPMWRPAAVACLSVLVGVGIAAFQILEVLRMARRSIRSSLTYELFSEGSFTIGEAVLSLGAPIYHYIDSGTYLTPLAFVMALVAIGSIVRRRVKDERIWFWLFTAAVAFLLLLGPNTPLNWLVYHIPVLNGFRVPSRHTFEWTLAVSVLAAFGWDIVEAYFRRGQSERAVATNHKTIVAVALIVAAAIVGVLFWRALSQEPEPNPSIYTGLPERLYWWWKIVLTVLVLAAGYFGFQIARQRTRVICLAFVIGLACFVEANATVNCWWAGLLSLPKERFHVVSNSTRYLQQFPSEQNRVYTRVGLFSEEFTTEPRLESTNLSMLYNVQNVAGMEPLILERYSRALGNVGPDSVSPRVGMPQKNLFLSQSKVLDILNTTYLVTYAGSLGIYEDAVTEHERVRISVGDLNISLRPGESADFDNRQIPGDQLALVTSLSNSSTEVDNKAVARIRFFTSDGRVVERDLLPGAHTAEWAHERPDIRPTIKHGLATVFDQRPGDEQNSFPSYRYWAKLTLDGPENVVRVQVTNLSQTATVSLWKLSLFNSANGQSWPLWLSHSPAWSKVFEDRGVEVLKNTNALPRAWLVTQAQAVDGETALEMIRGEGKVPFNPRETVLLEVRPDELPQLPGGGIGSDSEVRLVAYQPTHLSLETNAATSTVLVVSEIFYPGWRVTVDGQPSRIMLADFLLRAVALPAGKHKVEMYYSPTPAYVGAGVSIATVVLLSTLAVYGRRKQQQSKRSDS